MFQLCNVPQLVWHWVHRSIYGVVSQGVMPIAHKGMLQAAKSNDLSAITLIDNPAFIEEAKKEWQERLAGGDVCSFIPQDAAPSKL